MEKIDYASTITGEPNVDSLETKIDVNSIKTKLTNLTVEQRKIEYPRAPEGDSANYAAAAIVYKGKVYYSKGHRAKGDGEDWLHSERAALADVIDVVRKAGAKIPGLTKTGQDPTEDEMGRLKPLCDALNRSDFEVFVFTEKVPCHNERTKGQMNIPCKQYLPALLGRHMNNVFYVADDQLELMRILPGAIRVQETRMYIASIADATQKLRESESKLSESSSDPSSSSSSSSSPLFSGSGNSSSSSSSPLFPGSGSSSSSSSSSSSGSGNSSSSSSPASSSNGLHSSSSSNISENSLLFEQLQAQEDIKSAKKLQRELNGEFPVHLQAATHEIELPNRRLSDLGEVKEARALDSTLALDPVPYNQSGDSKTAKKKKQPGKKTADSSHQTQNTPIEFAPQAPQSSPTLSTSQSKTKMKENSPFSESDNSSSFSSGSDGLRPSSSPNISGDSAPVKPLKAEKDAKLDKKLQRELKEESPAHLQGAAQKMQLPNRGPSGLEREVKETNENPMQILQNNIVGSSSQEPLPSRVPSTINVKNSESAVNIVLKDTLLGTALGATFAVSAIGIAYIANPITTVNLLTDAGGVVALTGLAVTGIGAAVGAVGGVINAAINSSSSSQTREAAVAAPAAAARNVNDVQPTAQISNQVKDQQAAQFNSAVSKLKELKGTSEVSQLQPEGKPILNAQELAASESPNGNEKANKVKELPKNKPAKEKKGKNQKPKMRNS